MIRVCYNENIPVRFKGDDLVWVKFPDGTGPLAPLHHLDENGDVAFEALYEDSYGHVFPGGVIMCYGKQVGTVYDLTFLPQPKCMKSKTS